MSNEPTVVELQALVADLTARLSALEGEVATLKQQQTEEVPEDVLVAISAAVSAYLGFKATVRAVRLRGNSNWALQARRAAQDRQVLHVR
ncbi:hypothetical protein [Nigerium massiliense]|uniref:hypothetical protein n=1 Tax=Nigerium massiliense TaxID=1522317 RepID=UPI00058DFAAA|nr:hypothetical protein [Nigerium massiliense]